MVGNLRNFRISSLAFLGLVFSGIIVRLVFLILAGDLQPQADEWNNIYLALSWNRFSFYNDTIRFLWPPGYPFLLSCFLKWFGFRGIFYIKLFQVLLSGVIGATIILIAKSIFSKKASWVAGLIWCFYIPLIAFTHYNWAETIYLVFLLPSVYFLIQWLKNPDNSINAQFLLLISGLFFGVSLLFKEVGTLLAVILIFFIVWWSARVVSSVTNKTLYGDGTGFSPGEQAKINKRIIPSNIKNKFLMTDLFSLMIFYL